jgi:hypothetical protein
MLITLPPGMSAATVAALSCAINIEQAPAGGTAFVAGSGIYACNVEGIIPNAAITYYCSGVFQVS